MDLYLMREGVEQIKETVEDHYIPIKPNPS
jgi:hypothetical protein